MTWEQLSEKLGRPVEERTTVTRKVRRIGIWDKELFRKAVRMNGPRPAVALTFVDYLAPEDHLVTRYSNLSETSRAFIRDRIDIEDVDLQLIGTGVHPTEGWVCIDRR
jgi:adenylosuccinate synthase